MSCAVVDDPVQVTMDPAAVPVPGTIWLSHESIMSLVKVRTIVGVIEPVTLSRYVADELLCSVALVCAGMLRVRDHRDNHGRRHAVEAVGICLEPGARGGRGRGCPEQDRADRIGVDQDHAGCSIESRR